MRLEHYPLEKMKREIIGIVGRYLDLTNYRVFFFGSRVTGQGTENSDIDIGIEGPAPVPWSVMAKVRGEVEELPTLYKIDIVDFQNVSSRFKKVATQSVEFITAWKMKQ